MVELMEMYQAVLEDCEGRNRLKHHMLVAPSILLSQVLINVFIFRHLGHLSIFSSDNWTPHLKYIKTNARRPIIDAQLHHNNLSYHSYKDYSYDIPHGVKKGIKIAVGCASLK